MIDPTGRRVTLIPMTGPDVEIPRGDLASLLFATVRDNAEVLPDDTITA